jgi:hypothetical protein
MKSPIGSIAIFAILAARAAAGAGAAPSAQALRIPLSRVDGIDYGIFMSVDFDPATVSRAAAKAALRLPDRLPEGARVGVTPSDDVFVIMEPRPATPANFDPHFVVKSYTLKHIGASEFLALAKLYISASTASGNVITVRVPKSQIPDFEELLRQADVERKSIVFRLYAVIALPNAPAAIPPGQTSNAELRGVLDELKNVWNFRAFRSGNPAFLTVLDGSGEHGCRLFAEDEAFDLRIVRPQIRGQQAGKRTIAVGQIRLSPAGAGDASPIIESSEVILKENGYLVVGISGTGPSQAVILVLSAEIK